MIASASPPRPLLSIWIGTLLLATAGARPAGASAAKDERSRPAQASTGSATAPPTAASSSAADHGPSTARHRSETDNEAQPRQASAEPSSTDRSSGEKDGQAAGSDGAPARRAVTEARTGDTGSSSGGQQWPRLQTGVWEIEGTLRQNGRLRHWTEKTRQCEDSTALFQGHRGRASGRHGGGCEFQSTKVSDSEYKVTAECLVSSRAGRHGARYGIKTGAKSTATSESTVTVKGDKAFEMQSRLRAGERESRTTQTARWISDCTAARAKRR